MFMNEYGWILMVKRNSYVLLCTSLLVATYVNVSKQAYTRIQKMYYWIIMYFSLILGFRVNKPM